MPSTIEFELKDVPESWSNTGVYSRRAAMAQSKKMKIWTENTLNWASTRRIQAGWEIAQIDHPQRTLTIHQLRHGVLDDDNLYSSVKPIVDGCKSYLRRSGKTIIAGGLVYNDNPKHCHIEVTQERVPFKVRCQTLIKVERFDLWESSLTKIVIWFKDGFKDGFTKHEIETYIEDSNLDKLTETDKETYITNWCREYLTHFLEWGWMESGEEEQIYN
jgi:hypothetical protein